MEQQGGRAAWINMTVDQVMWPRATSLANCDATAGTYWIDDDTSATPTLYVHIAGGGNPTGDGHAYEVSARLSPIQAYTRADCAAYSLELRLPGYTGGAWFTVERCTLDDLLVPSGNYHSIIYGPGSVVSNLVVGDAYCDPAQTMTAIEVYAEDGRARTTTTDTCRVTVNHPECNPVAYGGHTDGVHRDAARLYSGCYASGCVAAYSGYDVDQLTIAAPASGPALPRQVSVGSNTVILNATLASTSDTVGFQGPGLTLTVTNSSLTPGSGQTAIVSVADSTTILLSGATFPSADQAVYHAGAAAVLHANACQVHAQYAFRLPGADAAYIGDYNHFKAGVQFQYRSGAYIGLAAWQIATGQDTHSVEDL